MTTGLRSPGQAGAMAGNQQARIGGPSETA